MSSEDTNRTGGNRTTAATSGALNRAARSGLCTAQFLGIASKTTKITTISKTVADHDADRAQPLLGQHADQGGRHQLADEDEQQDRVQEPLGVLDQPDERPAPRGGDRRAAPWPSPGRCG